MNRTLDLDQQVLLVRYTQSETREPGFGRSGLMTLMVLVLTLLAGWGLSLVTVPEILPTGGSSARPIVVSLERFKKTVMAMPEKPVVQAAEIPVLEPETILAAPVDRPVEMKKEIPAAAPQEQEVKAEPTPPARRVYGVRKVYARGLGQGGSDGAGLVTKQGNTLSGKRDTLTATEADLQGQLAALSTVEKAPEPIRRVKPEYSKAMLETQLRGEVTAYLLVDVDGTVRDVKITEDIGADSQQVAEAALREFTFKPAIKQGRPVAVWILHRIRFEFQQ